MSNMISLDSVTPDMMNVSRRELLDSISTRALYEHENNGGEKTAVALGRYYDRAKRLDNFTLSQACALGLDWNAHINSHRRTGDRFNIYAIPKVWEALRVLRGGSFDVTGNDGATLLGVILALDSGITNQKRIENYLNNYMNDPQGGARSGSWHSGNTQASSSLRALEALGIVARTGRDSLCNLWGVANRERFDMLLKRENASAPAETAETAENAPAPSKGKGRKSKSA